MMCVLLAGGFGLKNALPGWLRAFPVLAILSLIAPVPAAAQRAEVGGGVFVNSELDHYLRVLQGRGLVPAYPWSVRSFSPAEAERLLPADTALHPWAQRVRAPEVEAGRLRFHWIQPAGQLFYNSAFPFSDNSGPVWAGRGVTAALEGGLAARYGPLSLVLAPQVYLAQNAGFELAPPAEGGSEYADYRGWGLIDVPQRFGDGSFSRVDAGQSTLRIDLLGAAVGVSTANQHWGPAREYPLLLGNNAPGFPHVFAGTSRPANLWIGRLHGRMTWGRLEESPYSPGPDSLSTRFVAGMAATFTPRGAPGLELGVARFYHLRWLEGGPRGWQLSIPFNAIFGIDAGNQQEGEATDNQLASVFFRWHFPRSGFEAYGEYAREDFNRDLRDLLLQPDHNSAYMVGLAKSWGAQDSRLRVARVEVVNALVSHLAWVRLQVPFYVHHQFQQGHTHRGQILGAPAAFGGSGLALAVDTYHPGGRWTLSWRRELRLQNYAHLDGIVREQDGDDVIHTLGADVLLFRGRWSLGMGLHGMYNFNRDLTHDVFNLHGTLGVRAALR